MKRFFAALFCTLLFLTGWIDDARAQNSGRAAAEAHISKAKALAYEPGQDLIDVYENQCEPAMSEKGPDQPPLQVAPSLAASKVPPRSELSTAPVKECANHYW